jgi:hypothetical protein
MKTSYEKVEQITKYITIFFLILALMFSQARPESQLLGFWVCASIAFLSLFVSVYNDIRHKQFYKLKRWALAIGGVALITAIHFLFIA